MRYIGLLIVALLALFAAAPAFAHATGTSSDDSGNGHIELCNPNDVVPGRFSDANRTWNLSHDFARPIMNDVTGFGIPCEVKVVRRAGDGIEGPGMYYAETLYYNDKPDQIIIYDPFFDLTDHGKNHVVVHEEGHTIGLDHNGQCGMSVMTTISYCQSRDEPFRETPGSHDIDDLRNYWNDSTPIYP